MLANTKSVPNRAQRRAEASRERNFETYKKKTNLSFSRMEGSKAKRLALEARIAKTVARRKIRDAVRKGIAQVQGVNWKRVVLTGKVEAGKPTPYVIRASK